MRLNSAEPLTDFRRSRGFVAPSPICPELNSKKRSKLRPIHLMELLPLIEQGQAPFPAYDIP